MKNTYKIMGEITEIDIKVNGRTMITAISTKDLPRLLAQNTTVYGHIDNQSSKVYARFNSNNGKGVRLLHRFLLDIEDSELVSDHINGNTLDNTQDNLRAVTHKTNMWNRDMNKPVVRKHENGYGIFDGSSKILIDSGFISKDIATKWSAIYSMGFYPERSQFTDYDRIFK